MSNTTTMTQKEIDEKYLREMRRLLEDMADSAEMLWVCLANVSGGDWKKQSKDWQEATEKWRDKYLACNQKYIEFFKSND